jgi:hypothetical protein
MYRASATRAFELRSCAVVSVCSKFEHENYSLSSIVFECSTLKSINLNVELSRLKITKTQLVWMMLRLAKTVL